MCCAAMMPMKVKFVVVDFFESLEAVRRFAGENYTAAVFEREARRLLCRIEPSATHHRVRVNTI